MGVGTEKTFVATITPTEQVSAQFVCRNGHTVIGTSVYVVGNTPRLGDWNPALAVELDPNGPHPTWTGSIGGLPDRTAIAWKCIKRPETSPNPVEWEPGANNVFTTSAGGGTTTGDFAS